MVVDDEFVTEEEPAVKFMKSIATSLRDEGKGKQRDVIPNSTLMGVDKDRKYSLTKSPVKEKNKSPR